MTKISIRGITLHAKIVGHGAPLALMHGGPGADLYTMMAYKPLADQHTLVFYDHRCNGRSTGADVTTMNWDNLTADADALREKLGFEKWAILGHSFGGNVALEYALRYPDRLTHLVLVDTCADNRWAHVNAPKVLAERGFSPEIVDLSHRFLNGQIEPGEMRSDLMKLGDAYVYHMSLRQMPHMLLMGLQTKLAPEALIYSASHFLKGWNILDRLHEIQTPTLILSGRQDFVFPPECQQELAAGIPNSRLVIIDKAGHNVHDEQPAQVMPVLREFLAGVPVRSLL